MNNRILKNFFRDEMGFAAVFFLNSLLIALFYYLATDKAVEIFYPVLLSVFLYVIYLVIRGFNYYSFNSKLSKSIHNMNYYLQPATCEQKDTAIVISQIHQNYIEKIQNIRLENQQNKHFISQWIHNMKAPVSVIDLIVQKAAKGDMEALDAINDIKDENDRLLTNLEQVLSLLRLEDFSRDYVPEATDLAASLRNVINGRKNQFIYNNVFPRFEPQAAPVQVLSDAKWNELMIDQIVSNAIKYSQAGETAKNIYFRIEKREGQVTLAIRDEGTGIPDHDLKRIFEPFFTGENGRRFKNSTGIGLYICAEIAKRLGHGIDIQSEPGKGTEVKITYLSKL